MILQKRIVSLLLAFLIIFTIVPMQSFAETNTEEIIFDNHSIKKTDFESDSLADNNQKFGELKISKEVSGDSISNRDIIYTFIISKESIPAIGKYTIDKVNILDIPQDGKIQLRAGQTALLSELETGTYKVEEIKPAEENYKYTTFKVNDEEPQKGLVAEVEVVESVKANNSENEIEEVIGGWLVDERGLVKQDEDGYFVYTITPEQIIDRKIHMNCNPLAEYMAYMMYKSVNTTVANVKIKIKNKSGQSIKYEDYDFSTVNWLNPGGIYIPSDNPEIKNIGRNGLGEAWRHRNPVTVEGKEEGYVYDIEGFDGENIRITSAPLRTPNPAVISYFMSNPGKDKGLTSNSNITGASDITLKQMNAFPELIKESFTFKNHKGVEITFDEDSSRTYADFVCAFYEVDSLEDLTYTQKYNQFGSGNASSPSIPGGSYNINQYYNGTYNGKKMPKADLEGDALNYFKTWGLATYIAQDSNNYYDPYYLLENDEDIIKLGYEYLYERGMRITFDDNDRNITIEPDSSVEINSMDVCGIKTYLDKDNISNSHIVKVMNEGNAIEDGEEIVLDNVKGFIEVPNVFYSALFDFGFLFTFGTEGEVTPTEEIATVIFNNVYKNVEKEPITNYTGGSSWGVPKLNKKDHYAYMIGYPDGNFKPNDEITKAEAVTIFFRMLEEDSRKEFWSTESSFKDVDSTAWYNNALSTMERASIIEADEDDNFRPNESMTRAEFAVLMSKFFKETKTSTHKFTDIDGHWAEAEIARVAEKGWIEGYLDNTFRPDEPISRSETAKLVNAILERTPNKDKLLPI
ncbi:S-layer homology domain-containing protein [Anaerosphaera multitolerans]|uniref:S-layer homology domain-containing protein n=1 Tax=Anaerosphaera multitolerans TaxID=2487351 RepID=A0A437S4G9_9FIRM|nr:S-layer homology domain-containing protein [Anaerosphaera multitolerans]RVU53911.1 S-layer homology domain-containing protein [Anaerosphaera multitolerans]